MAARKPGRYLAPIALLAIVAAIFLVVHANQPASSHATTGSEIPRTLAHSPTHSRHSHAAHHRRVYTVQPGDTLSGIAAKTRVPVATLQALNPGVDPNALQTGQQLRLHR
jgi:peptidoglycan DL-endopeptidase LytE